MKKLYFMLLLIAIAGTLLFAACTSPAEPAPAAPPAQEAAPAPAQEAAPAPEEDEEDEAADEAADEMLYDGVPRGTGVPLVIYSNSFTDEREEWLDELAGRYGFVIQPVAAGGGAIADRLVAERHSPIADVVFGLNVFLWQRLIDYDIIIPYTPVWADEIVEGLNHPGGYYHALVKQAILLMYDQNQLDPADAPTDWLDLWMDERFHWLYQFETALTGGTTRMVLAGILARYIDPNGHLGVSDEGWAHIAAYYRYGYPNRGAIDLAAQMVDPDIPVIMGQIWHAGIPMREEQHGISAGWVVPAVGVPFVVEGIAPVSGTAHLEEAQRFIDWFGSAYVQTLWQERFDSLPANRYALANIDAFNRTISQLPVQEVDWEFVATRIEDWAEHIYLTYMP